MLKADAVRARRRASRRVIRAFGRGAACAIITLAAASRLSAQNAATSPPFPPSGQLVDVGGWRLHLNCTGTATASQPTVILEAGIGDFSVEWSLVQPEVAKFARVCSYDRADEGWSDFGPHPRTLHQIVYELHTMLDRGSVPPPYVLVGHSFGGVVVRLFRLTYPSEVVGMVLVEAGADNPLRMLPNGNVVHAADLATGKTIPAVKTANPVHEADIPLGVLAQLQAAARENASRANEAPRNKLPMDAQRMRSWTFAQVKHWAQGDNPVEAEELAQLRDERTKVEFPYGDMALVVLTRGISDETGPDSKALEQEHRADHAAVAKLSRRGQLVVATRSGHHVQIDEPELVIGAIRGVLSAAKR
jgi:pimeloyl-ACP methyl ester carboxylesterase